MSKKVPTPKRDNGTNSGDLAPLLPSIIARVRWGCGPWWTGWQRLKGVSPSRLVWGRWVL